LPSAARTPRSPAGNASGSPSARIATYSAVHGADAGQRAEACGERLGAVGRVERERTRRDRLSERADRRAARLRQADRLDRRVGEVGGEGEEAREAGPSSTGVPKRSTSRPASVVAARTLTCWPSTGAHRELERIPCAGDAEAAELPDDRPQPCVAPEVRPDAERIGAQVEEAAHALDDVDEPRVVRRLDAEHDLRALGIGPHLDAAGSSPMRTVRR
jgi:hypothetical protein